MQVMTCGFWALPWIITLLSSWETVLLWPCLNLSICIQLFRDRLSEKMCTRKIPKGNMGYDQYTVPDDWSCRTYFCCFPLALANICPWPPVSFFQIYLKSRALKTTHNTFRDCRVHFFPTTFLEIAVNGYRRDASFLHLRFTWVPRFPPALSKQLSHRPLCWPLFCSYQYNWRQFLWYRQKSFKTDQR